MHTKTSIGRNGSSARLRLFLPAVIAITVLLLFGRIIAKGFLSLNNISSILMTSSLLVLVSMAQNTVVISGDNGIDLSVGAIASFTAIFIPTLPMENLGEFLLALLIAVGIGALIGMFNGVFTRVVGVPALIMTTIMASVVSGIKMVVTHGRPATSISSLLQSISATVVPPIRVLTLVVLVIVIAGEIILTRTRAGRTLRIIGDNANAAKICGTNVRLVGVLAYSISGALAGLMGVLLVGYIGQTTMNMASSYTLFSLAAITIGGTNLAGGKGSFVSGALGSIALVIMNSILQALNMAQGLRSVIQGGLLLLIMLINNSSTRRSSR